MKPVLSFRRHSKKNKLNLASLTLKRDTFIEEKTNRKVKSPPMRSCSALQFFWQRRYISLEDYLVACKYVELGAFVRKIMGVPRGFNNKVAWFQPAGVSQVSWIQSELSLLEQNRLSYCTDNELLSLWKALQGALSQLPLGLRKKFEQLLFEDKVTNFHANERLYLKALQKHLPPIKAFMLAFWKQKSPQ